MYWSVIAGHDETVKQLPNLFKEQVFFATVATSDVDEVHWLQFVAVKAVAPS
jgi:hypothetical protein